MSRLNEYNPEFGVVFDEWDDFIKSLQGGSTTGGGTSGTKPTGTTTYAQDSLKDKQNTLQGQPGIKSLADLQGTPGARYINSATIGLPDGSKYQLRGDGSGLWGVGYSMTKAEQGQYLAGAPVGAPAAVPGAQGSQPQGLPAPAQGTASLMNPGMPGTITRGLTNDNGNLLNQIQVHNPGMGFNGFINKEEPQRAPGLAALGTGPAISANLHNFSQGARGFTYDPNPMGPVSYTTPSSFNPQTGFNNQDYAVPTTVGVSYGTPSYNPLAPSSPTIPLEMAGSNVQMFRPDGSSTGFVRDAMPASNIGLAQGRDFSSLNPAAQAAAQFALLDRMEGGRLSGAYGPPAAAAAPPVAYNPVGQGVAGVGSGLMQGMQNMLGTGSRPSYDTTPVGGVPARGPDAFGPPAPAAGGIIGSTASATLPGATPNGQPSMADVLAQAQAALAAAEAAKKEDEDRLAATSSGVYGGADGGTRFMARGGSIVTAPLSAGATAPSPKSLVTTGPKALVDIETGKVEAIMGEDNTDPGRAPNSELLQFSGPRNTRLQVTPLEPARMAGGGSVMNFAPLPPPVMAPNYMALPTPFYSPGRPIMDISPLQMEMMQRLKREREAGMMQMQQQGGSGPPRRFATGGTVNLLPPPAPATVQMDPGGMANTPAAPTTFSPSAATAGPMDDPFGAMLPPWEKAAQQLAGETANRNRLQYRRRAGGLGAEVGVPVLQGEATGRLLPGQYWDYQPQVNNMISDILSNQSQYRTLGPGEDVNPLYGRVGEIDTGLKGFESVRNLEDQIPGLQALNDQAQQAARDRLGVSAYQLDVAKQYKNAADTALYEYLLNNSAAVDETTRLKLETAQYEAASKIAEIQYQIAQDTAASTGVTPALLNLNARLDAERARLTGLNESGLRTELALLNQRLSNQTKRTQLQNTAQNLSQMGVPNLSAPLATGGVTHAVGTAAPAAMAGGGTVTIRKPRKRSVKLPSGRKLTIEEAD